MEKDNRNNEVKTKRKNKEKSPKIFKPVVSFTGLPGSNLSLVFKEISQSVSREINEFDLAKLHIIDNITGFYSPNAPIKSVDNGGVNRTDISTAPSEVLYMLASYLHPRDCLQILLVNKKFYQIFNVLSVWKKYCLARGVENCSSLTINECKKLLFEENWTFVEEFDYKVKQRLIFDIPQSKLCHDIWTLRAIPLATYLKNYHYMRVQENENLLFFIVDISKYDMEITEPDSTKINYIDKCSQILEQISMRPFGPITKKQYKQASAKKKGLGRIWQDFCQPFQFSYTVAVLTGLEEFKAKVLRDPNFPVAVHEDNQYLQYFQEKLKGNMSVVSALALIQVHWGALTFATVTHYRNKADIIREIDLMTARGLIKFARNF